MASCQLPSFFVLVSLLLFVVSQSHSMYEAPPPRPPVYSQKVLLDPQKVTMSLYYESLCPSSQDFIVHHLALVLNTDLMTILNLRLVPWGNAILQPDKTIICQHGEEECYLNTIQACGIYLWPDVKKNFDFIECTEQQDSSHGAEAGWTMCADQLKLPKQAITHCYDSGFGRKLTLQYGNETDHLNPSHEYVPWVIVNDRPLDDDYENFAKYICEAYTGKPVPKSCGQHLTNSIEKKQPFREVCLANQAGPAKGSWMHQLKMEPTA